MARSGKLSEDDWPHITGATKQLQDAKMILWKGHCSVHGRFSDRVSTESDEHRGVRAGFRFLFGDPVLRMITLAWVVLLAGVVGAARTHAVTGNTGGLSRGRGDPGPVPLGAGRGRRRTASRSSLLASSSPRARCCSPRRQPHL